MRRVIVAVALMLAVASTAFAKTPKLAPVYKCTGSEDGEHYAVWLAVEQRDRAVRFHQIAENGAATGIAYGFLTDNTLSVTLWFSSGNFGTALYKVKGKKLVGEWQVVGATAIAPESCEVADSFPKPTVSDHTDSERVGL